MLISILYPLLYPRFYSYVDTSPKSSSTSTTPVPDFNPELHKVLLKPTPDCWRYALEFMAGMPDGGKFLRVLEDEEALIEFERQLIVKYMNIIYCSVISCVISCLYIVLY